jgi:glycine/sarcosine/betaine reductase complex component A
VKLHGRKVIVIGERDGVQASSLRACAEAAGASVILSHDHCFV